MENMVISESEYLEACKILSKHPCLKKNAVESLKGSAVTAGCTLAGGIFGGPIGLAAGATIGGLVAYATSAKYKSLIQIITEMSDEDQTNLINFMRDLCNERNITTAAILTAVVTNPSAENYEVLSTGLMKYCAEIQK